MFMSHLLSSLLSSHTPFTICSGPPSTTLYPHTLHHRFMLFSPHHTHSSSSHTQPPCTYFHCTYALMHMLHIPHHTIFSSHTHTHCAHVQSSPHTHTHTQTHYSVLIAHTKHCSVYTKHMTLQFTAHTLFSPHTVQFTHMHNF